MEISRSVVCFVISVVVAIGVVRAEPVRGTGAAPVSALIEDLAAAVGPDGAVGKVVARGQSVLFQGFARDPAAMLKSLSTSTTLDNPQLIPMAHDPNAELQPFVLTASLSVEPVQGANGSQNSVKSDDDLVEYARKALDSHMAAPCKLISDQPVGDGAADSANVRMMWRCPGTLVQMISALRELELGAPTPTLSDYAIYLPDAGKPSAGTDSQVEVRFIATAPNLAMR